MSKPALGIARRTDAVDARSCELRRAMEEAACVKVHEAYAVFLSSQHGQEALSCV